MTDARPFEPLCILPSTPPTAPGGTPSASAASEISGMDVKAARFMPPPSVTTSPQPSDVDAAVPPVARRVFIESTWVR